MTHIYVEACRHGELRDPCSTSDLLWFIPYCCAGSIVVVDWIAVRHWKKRKMRGVTDPLDH